MVHLIDQAASLQHACRVLYMLPLKVSEATFKHVQARLSSTMRRTRHAL